MRVLTIDPGSYVTGWAFAGLLHPSWQQDMLSGVLKAPRKDKIHRRNVTLCQGLLDLLSMIEGPDVVVMESPPSFTYNKHTNSWSGKPKNWRDILTLTRTVGALGHTLAMHGFEPVEVDATVWKGRMNKNMAKMLSGKTDHNEADAVELLKWWRGEGQYMDRAALTRGKR